MAFVDADKLSYEIFSVLESKFLFGLDDPNKLFFPTSSYSSAGASPRTAAGARGRIRILSIDGGGSPSDALLAAVALARLGSSLRHRSGDPSARVAYMFDVAAGSGAGGVLVAMLFTRDHDGRPFFFRRIFGDATLRDTVKPVLIPGRRVRLPDVGSVRGHVRRRIHRGGRSAVGGRADARHRGGDGQPCGRGHHARPPQQAGVPVRGRGGRPHGGVSRRFRPRASRTGCR
ncbi:unnamed protein product [Musa banksii]